MGSGGSKPGIERLARHYNELVDSMRKNQVVFDVRAKNVARTEQEWFRRFESGLDGPPVSEDALYDSIADFVRRGREDREGLERAVEDPALREQARRLLASMDSTVAMQKYYEYKYLHLSAVFLHFTDFVQRLMEVMGDGLLEASRGSSAATAADIGRLADAIGDGAISPQQARRLQRSARGVHDRALERIEELGDKMRAVADLSGRQVREFPAEQIAAQRREESRAYTRDRRGRFASAGPAGPARRPPTGPPAKQAGPAEQTAATPPTGAPTGPAERAGPAEQTTGAPTGPAERTGPAEQTTGAPTGPAEQTTSEAPTGPAEQTAEAPAGPAEAPAGPQAEPAGPAAKGATGMERTFAGGAVATRRLAAVRRALSSSP
mgnify:CR=1 FL=1